MLASLSSASSTIFLLFALLSTGFPSVIASGDGDGDGDAKMIVNIPEYTTYRDAGNPSDFVWGGHPKELIFDKAQRDDKFAYKFKLQTWAEMEKGDYTHGSVELDLTCYARASQEGDSEWIFTHDGLIKVVKRASGSRIWCPQDQGLCHTEDCKLPVVDTDL
ncbi:uncharacterized protein I303_106249 [Kwoniella dejecticola CBS 10117]|uniref:Uncharacterized protein n=1 Tax=Kwoniella dejecticola CBS 10117 TaxID=1296121 RepID=A0A1A6A1P2_9TREE|nr:uncharacterized protein I303_06268 [Kwoniella dejecticola CBS 10117]OBR83981.1 hypothetical protein I303_06268 [Kwoniella dejecticola CBS 10117]